MTRSCDLLALCGLLGVAACATADLPTALPPTQIAWQRSLDDALRLAKLTGRPLFVAVNMDGESASERIVRENYRDPAFVALTRQCVCVTGSLFRHNARDHDEHGRRIPCPRLGSVTCGEHIALEPLLFEKVLQGERVAPRHAFVLGDGKKVFDESLLFDIRDLDRMLADALRGQGVGQGAGPVAPRVGEDLVAVTEAPFATARAHHEARIVDARLDATLRRELDAIRGTGDAAWRDALRLALYRIPELGSAQELDAALVDTAKAIGAAGDLAQTLRDELTAVVEVPAEGRLTLRRPGDPRYLRLLLAVDPDAAQTRTWILGRRIVAGVTAPPDRDQDVEAVIQGSGGPVDLPALFDLADRITRGASDPLPRPGPTTDEMPAAEELVRRLEALDRQQQAAADPERIAAVAKATLDLARRRMESGSREVPLLLEDAARLFGQALGARPDRAEWWIEAARTAYFQQDFARQSECGRRALAASRGSGPLPGERDLAPGAPVLNDATAVEALRWIGDAEARLMAGRGEEPAPVQARGMLGAVRSLGLVAASPYATVKDWIGLVSLVESLGLVRASLEANLCAAERFPADAELRQALRGILWSIGRIDLEPAAAQRIAGRHPASGAARWFVGYGHLMVAEDHRRAERPDAAVAAYERAEAAFTEAARIAPDLAASCTHYTGVSWLGRGMAHLLAVRQPRAADALAAAARSGASIRTARDGLDRDVFDLVDQSLEWRAGRRSPVDALELLDRLEQAEPGTGFWAGAVSDTMLREALRADGKNPRKVERATVDAAGEKIRMPMGLPTTLGDAYLADAIAAGRRALRHTDGDRKPLAQALTIAGERALQRLAEGDGDTAALLEVARGSLREAAPMQGVPAPPPDADRAALDRTAAALRTRLGEARPRFRDGR